ncbi:MAG: hypothetical protein EOP18_03565, partial [Rhizobiaceae bacterium]
MKTRFTTGLLASSFLLMGFANAYADDGERYYAGSFTCGGDRYNTDWVISRDLSGASRVRVYTQEQGSTQVRWLDLSERTHNGGAALVDANGNIALSLEGEGDSLKAIWLAGAPASECERFEVAKTESAKARFDALFTLLDTPEPKAGQASEVAARVTSLPNFFAVPELDQQAYQQRYGTALPEFWTRYRTGLISDLSRLPVTDDATRTSYVATMRQAFGEALASSMGDNRRSEGREEMTLALRLASDRLADAGQPLAAAVDMSGPAELCARLDLLSRINRGSVNLRDLELTTRVAFDYWTR